MTTLKIKDSIWASKITTTTFDVDVTVRESLVNFDSPVLLDCMRAFELLQESLDDASSTVPKPTANCIGVAAMALLKDDNFHKMSSLHHTTLANAVIAADATLTAIWAAYKLGLHDTEHQFISTRSPYSINYLVNLVKLEKEREAGSLSLLCMSYDDAKQRCVYDYLDEALYKVSWDNPFRLDALEFIITALANVLTERDLAE